MTPQQRLIEQSKRRKNNPENTTNIVQMPNRAPRLRMTSIRQMARSVTNAGYGLVPQRFAGRNDNDEEPSNTHITETLHGSPHAPQRFEEYNVYEALSSTSPVSNIDCGYGFAPQRFPGRNHSEAGPSNTHITDRFPRRNDNEAGPSNTHITDRFPGRNDNEAGPSNTHITGTEHG
ncbi:hypothetical protein DEO72_LG9g2855 [Vigna unguiculata]|uniref:Uncharacterized protein n=1 Tax=Vigna unguiculata TaxID=3917 RepID=A0A4D6MQQ2_VIGUN|nr:hypothetical protein DEO72_LG8g998 [Vigna unguiculata]QCE07835.1 hypothetical protein DEO72_LG9g2855 [Vigna unguiculata]